jgi:hypothetical protein
MYSNMYKIGIISIVRQDQDILQDLVLFSAGNGAFQGRIQLYLEKRHLKQIAKAFSSFPDKIPNESSFSVGSLQPENKSQYLMLRAYTAGQLAPAALQIIMNNKRDTPDEGECRFSILAEPWAIHRLGELVLRFSDYKYRALHWSLDSDNDALSKWGNETEDMRRNL